MNTTTLSRTTGYLSIVAATLVILGQLVLLVTFGYPEVLGNPMSVVLERYHAAGAPMRSAWFAFAMGTLLLVPLASLFRRLLGTSQSVILDIATAFGGIAGFAYTIGIMRWVLVADVLSNRSLDPHATAAQREAAVAIFQALDVYCGNSFGETIAPLAHGVWATLLGVVLLRSGVVAKWMASAQLILGLVIATRPLEYVGFKAIGEISDIGTGVWTVLLVVMGVGLIRRPLTAMPSEQHVV